MWSAGPASEMTTLPGKRDHRVCRERLACGTVIDGRYRLERALGDGAFGDVYAAERLRDGAMVAIKVLQQSGDAAGLARFREEAALLREARHPHVVGISDSCIADREHAYLVMELLNGPSLADRLREGPMAIPEVLKLARDALCAIHAFSSRGIVHLDLKPANMMLHRTKAGRPLWKVIDFGIAIRSGGTERATTCDVVVGTPRYMAPEQLRGGPIDVRTDLYALGALLYEAITGEPCHAHGHSVVDLIAATLHDDVLPICEMRPDCPRELEQLILCALAKDAGERPRSARQMLAHVEALIAQHCPTRWSLASLFKWFIGPTRTRLRSRAEPPASTSGFVATARQARLV